MSGGKAVAKKKMNKAEFREHCWGLAFVSPAFIGFLIFMAFPIAFAFFASLTKWNGMNSMTDNFVGLSNYIKLLGDDKFWKVLLNTVIYMIGIPIGMILGLVIAVGMNRKIKGIKFLRTLYYVPVVSWNLFRDITVPLVSPVTFYLLITGLIGGFQVFVEVLVMVPSGGLNYSAATVVFYLYEKAFSSNQMGYGSAMAFILAIFIFIVTAINFKGQDKWVKTIE